MPYVFRKYPGYNPNEIKCWSPSRVIDSNSFEVENINFVKGESKAGTSIPSPLARMELFDTAFNIVASDKIGLSGTTLYHHLVSECLDMMQLIFNSKNNEIGLGKKIFFREWNVQQNIKLLKDKGENHPNSLLAKAYDQFFADDRFKDTESIFLIYYENKLVGGTSPLSLVFTSPNWSRYLEDGLIANRPQSNDGHMYFAQQSIPLHERDVDFVEYLYKLLKLNPDAFNKAAGLRSYINRTIDNHFKELRFKLESYSLSDLETDFSKVETKVDNKILSINGLYFYHQKESKERDRIKSVSDFKIKATVAKYAHENVNGVPVNIDPPLVLVKGMNVRGNYIDRNVPWDSGTEIREYYYKGIPLYERKLPYKSGLTITYPFLTTEDFLEDNLVELPFIINKKWFITCTEENIKYLLPVKKEYFDFFSIDDLKRHLKITRDPDSGKVTVKLNIPIDNTKGVPSIEFIKTYSKGTNIIECRVGLGIYPFLRLSTDEQILAALNEYTILLAEGKKSPQPASLKFYNYSKHSSEGETNSRYVPRSTFTTVEAGDSSAASTYYFLNDVFDYMELSFTDDNGRQSNAMIIPDFQHRNFNSGMLNNSYTFSIDFGTSNTHVAYMGNTEPLPKPFEINENDDQQLILLNAPGDTPDTGEKYYQGYGSFGGMELVHRREFMPSVMLRDFRSSFSFPIKTATCEIAQFNSTDRNNANMFSHINIGYNIDREERIAHSVIYTTNLKWLLENKTDDANKSRVKFFLKQLLTQIKVKTILNRGKLNELNIIWTLPESMSRGNKTTLRQVLRDAFKEVFKDSGARLLDDMPESVAPYYFLTASRAIQGETNVVNLDVGGGTTDVMFFMEAAGNRTDRYLSTSFRFAGSDIWGSGFESRLKDNGFIRNYLNYKSSNNIKPEDKGVFAKIKDDSNLSSDDLISYLFKTDNQCKFSDSITAGNPDLSLVLYLHYSALIYHVVQIIKLKNFPLPRYLSFTGKGSQYIKLICGGDIQEIKEYTTRLIKAYTDQPLQNSFQIHLNENPKEITANGAALYAIERYNLANRGAKADQNLANQFESKQQLIFGGFNPEKETSLSKLQSQNESDGGEIKIKDVLDISSPINIAVLNNVNDFLDKTLGNNDIVKYLTEFKVSKSSDALKALKWNGNIENGEGIVYDSYRKVLKELRKRNHDGTDSPIPETLFFYALKDALYQLSIFLTPNQ